MSALSFRLLRGFIRWTDDIPTYKGIVPTEAYKARDVRDAVPCVNAKEGDVLQREQLPAWFREVGKISNPVQSAYLQGLLITGASREEWAGLRWVPMNTALMMGAAFVLFTLVLWGGVSQGKTWFVRRTARMGDEVGSNLADLFIFIGTQQVAAASALAVVVIPVVVYLVTQNIVFTMIAMMLSLFAPRLIVRRIQSRPYVPFINRVIFYLVNGISNVYSTGTTGGSGVPTSMNSCYGYSSVSGGFRIPIESEAIVRMQSPYRGG